MAIHIQSFRDLKKALGIIPNFGKLKSEAVEVCAKVARTKSEVVEVCAKVARTKSEAVEVSNLLKNITACL